MIVDEPNEPKESIQHVPEFLCRGGSDHIHKLRRRSGAETRYDNIKLVQSKKLCSSPQRLPNNVTCSVLTGPDEADKTYHSRR